MQIHYLKPEMVIICRKLNHVCFVRIAENRWVMASFQEIVVCVFTGWFICLDHWSANNVSDFFNMVGSEYTFSMSNLTLRTLH